MSNQHEQRARVAKAEKLAQVMWYTTIPVEEMRRADQVSREYLAEVAKVHVPSDTTWQIACDMLERRGTRAYGGATLPDGPSAVSGEVS